MCIGDLGKRSKILLYCSVATPPFKQVSKQKRRITEVTGERRATEAAPVELRNTGIGKKLQEIR